MPNTSTRAVAGRVSPDAFQQLEALATERGITRSQAVGALITAALPNAPAESVAMSTKVPAARELALRQEWSRPTFVAEQLKLAIENPELFGQYYRPRTFVMEVLPWRQHAISMFGLPAVLAATRRGADCKWCAAIRYAKRHSLPAPPVNAATKILLGEPCEKHGPSPAQRQAKIRSLTAGARRRSAESRALSRARIDVAYWRPLVASATVTKRDDQGQPVRLVTAKDSTGRRRILVRGVQGWVVAQ